VAEYPVKENTMTKLVAVVLFLAGAAVGQSEPAKRPAAKAPCVILSSIEPAKGIATWSVEGRHQKHALTYLAGDYPPGVPFRSSISDKDVDKIKAKGGRVIILDPHYTREDLDKAKQSCENSPENSDGKRDHS
jgi:hypothetical protein